MPEFILGARGHDFGRHDPETLFSSIGQAGFACTQLALPRRWRRKELCRCDPCAGGAGKDGCGSFRRGHCRGRHLCGAELCDEDKRHAEVAKVLSQIPVARALGAGCMGSETTNMAKQPV